MTAFDIWILFLETIPRKELQFSQEEGSFSLIFSSLPHAVPMYWLKSTPLQILTPLTSPALSLIHPWKTLVTQAIYFPQA